MNLKSVLWFVVLAIIVVALAYYGERRADAQQKAYQSYESCVVAQYGVLPSTYQQEHNGELPDCK